MSPVSSFPYDPPRGAPVGTAPAIAGGADPDPPCPAISPREVIAALRTVVDPELSMSVVELGLVYGIDIRAGVVAITMTLTTPGCPIHDVMPEWVRRAVSRIPGVDRVDVTLTFDPPWSPERIGSPASRASAAPD